VSRTTRTPKSGVASFMSSETPASGPSRYGSIGKYEVVAHLATGGMCVVYKAIDAPLSREVALKVLPPELAAKPNLLERFRREARHCAKLRHENIISIYEFGEANGTYYLALEFIDGIDLHEYVNNKGPLDSREAAQFLTQAARALDHLHKFQMVHRDIKPSNLMVTQQSGQPLIKLTDLGLARIAADDEFRVTRHGSTVGTIDYMSPEQARDSGTADIRSDIYSLGCTGYHMLTGRPPFPEGGLTERLYKHLAVDPPDIRKLNPRVSPQLARVLLRMLAKRPADRYQTPSELLRDLSSLDNLREPIANRLQERTRPDVTAETVDGWSETNRDLRLDATPDLLPGAEHRQAAAGQYQRAQEVLAKGNLDYGIHLLLSCCTLDPANLGYRRALRRAARSQYKRRTWSRRLNFLTAPAARVRLLSAKAASDHLKVLEEGELLLLRHPDDTTTHLDMARSAEALGLNELAIWLLEKGRRKKAPDINLCRTLAKLYEKNGRFREAIDIWEVVHKADPTDLEASRKARDLAATDTIARGQYEQDVDEDAD
jgi:serine/threonine protein kinase/DNA-binding XRE family transcriptional regulator